MAEKGKVNGVRYLRCKTMVGQSRNEANNSTRNAQSNSDPIGGSEGWGASKAIQASAGGFNLTGVSQRIERTRMNAEAKGMGGTEHTAMFGENLAGESS